MNLNLINDTTDTIIVRYDYNEVKIYSGDKVTITLQKAPTSFCIRSNGKSKIKNAWLSLLTKRFVSSYSDAKCFLKCNYQFDIMLNNNAEMHIGNIDRHINDFIHISSYKIFNNNAAEFAITNQSYMIEKYKKIKTLFVLIHLLILSGIPLEILGIISLIKEFRLILLIAMIIWLFVGLIPSVKIVIKFIKTCDEKQINHTINNDIEYYNDVDEANKIINDYIATESTQTEKKIARIIKHFIN